MSLPLWCLFCLELFVLRGPVQYLFFGWPHKAHDKSSEGFPSSLHQRYSYSQTCSQCLASASTQIT